MSPGRREGGGGVRDGGRGGGVRDRGRVALSTSAAPSSPSKRVVSAWTEVRGFLPSPPLPSLPDNLFEVCRALPAGIDAGQQLHQLSCIGLLLPAGAVGHLCCQGVQEGPRGPEV